jgi:hypothetical protein
MPSIKNKFTFMKKQILLPGILILFFAVVFTNCKKESSTTDPQTEVSAHSDDQSNFDSQIDDIANDADVAVESSSSFTGRTEQPQTLICNATVVVDTISNPRTITITYSGNNCLGTASRTGTVVLSMAAGVHWKDAGAALTVTCTNLHITRLSDNKSITINGAKTVTNVSGGLLINLPTLGTITHSITSSGITVTFDNGSQRSWQIAKQRVFTYNNGIVVTTTGTHTEGTTSGIVEWGVNRFGHAFATAITTPMVIRQDCNFRLVSGQILHVLPNVTATGTFGLNANGDPTTCPGTGHYYMKIVFVGQNGATIIVILPY